MGADGAFSKSLFEVYDELLVPLIFRSFAADVVPRLEGLTAGAILEVAAGTGAVTRVLAEALPPEVAIIATDLVPGMVERAELVGTARPVTWSQADAMSLPFDDESFDAVVCQFGAMFFVPRSEAYAEIRRVLRPGGRFLLSVWDRLDANELSAAVCDIVKGLFPDDPPGFLERTPYGYNDPAVIADDLRAGGFTQPPAVETIEHASTAATAIAVATAHCAGTPMREELERVAPGHLAAVIETTAAGLADRYGPGDLSGPTRALFVTAVK